MQIGRRLTVYAATAVLAAAAGVLAIPGTASAHGAMMKPGSRTFLCWKDARTPTGELKPRNPACAAAVAQSGITSLYNWFAVLRSDGAGRVDGFIPDGKLCSGDARVYNFSGYDLARNDWPLTHLTAGANFGWEYNNWARHPGTFRLYITKDSWSPTRPLAWSDLESTPFLSVTNPAESGGPGTEDGKYYWSGRLPANKTGRHLIYSVWARSDSQETFYNCSDVVFDGGNGEVTGVGDPGPGPSPSNPPTPGPSPSNPPSPSPSPNPGPTTPGPGNPNCVAAFRVISSWPAGFQGEVTVHNMGTAPMQGWRTSWSFPGGQTMSQTWNGVHQQDGPAVNVTNASWNGNLASHGSTTFGFIGNGPAPTSLQNLTCGNSPLS